LCPLLITNSAFKSESMLEESLSHIDEDKTSKSTVQTEKLKQEKEQKIKKMLSVAFSTKSFKEITS